MSGTSARRVPEEARDARVAVLDVEDGIVRGLAHRHRQVELERTIVPAREKREARRVAPDLLEQLLHQDELAAPLGHADGLAVAQQRHELHDEHVEALGRVARARASPP